MRTRTICLLALLMLYTPFAFSQSPSRCGGPNIALYINWPTTQFDNCRSGNNPYEHILSPSTVGNLQVKWIFDKFGTATSAILANGVLYVYLQGDNFGYWTAVDANTGTVIWWAGSALDGTTPTIDKGVLYDIDNDGLFARNASTGVVIWSRYDLINENSPAVADGLVYANGFENSHQIVLAVDAGTGSTVWKTPVASYPGGASSPTVVNGILYTSVTDYGDLQENVMLALNARTGAVVWATPVGPAGKANPAVVNGVVYFGSDDNKVWALDAHTGALLWSFATEGAVVSTPAVAKGVVYVTCEDARVYALDAATGKRLWSNETGGPVFASPAVANGVVYLGSTDSTIYAMDAGTGAILWMYYTEAERGIYWSPIIANGVLYSSGGYYLGLMAFQLPNQ